jgi:hypothetical protein
MESQPMEELQDAWVGFLDRVPWQWFATLTFRDEVHPEAADKRFKHLISMGNREIYGPRWAKKRKGIIWARAIETQRRGVIHMHALLSGVDELNPLTFMLRWSELSGFSKIEPVRCSLAVRQYVTKYVRKGGEIDIGGCWPSPSPSESAPSPPEVPAR